MTVASAGPLIDEAALSRRLFPPSDLVGFNPTSMASAPSAATP